MIPIKANQRILTASAIGPLLGFFVYVFLVGAATAVLPPLVAIMMGVLPLSVLFFNRDFAFQAPLRLMHVLFVAAIILFILWPRYLAFNFGGPDLTPARLVYAMLLGIWFGALVSPVFRSEMSGVLKKEKFWIRLVVGYFLLRFVSCFFSDAVLPSFYYTANELISVILVLPIALSIYRSTRRLETLVSWLFFAGVVVALLAIVERLVLHTLFANVTLPGMKIDSVWLEQAIMDKTRAGKYRVQSTFSHPLLLAEFMMFQLPLAFYIALRRGFWIRLVGIAGILLFLVAAVLTGSRSSLVAIIPMLGMGAILFACRQQQTQGRINIGAIVGILSLLGIFVGVIVFFAMFFFDVADFSLITGKSSLEISSTQTRLRMFQVGIPLILERPVVGYGPGLSAYLAGVTNSIATTIDSYYLSMGLDSGVLCLGVFMFLSFGVAIRGLRTAIHDSSQVGLLKGLLAISLVGILVVKSILSIPHNDPLLYLCLALILVTADNYQRKGAA